MIIKKVENLDTALQNMIGTEFTQYAARHQLNVNYTQFNFLAEENGAIVGLITGHSYYNEVHVSDLIILEKSRKNGIGSKLLQETEKHFKGKGYDLISLSTYKFQAPDFYLKHGFEIEYIRENQNEPNLTKYYFIKSY